MAYLYLTDQDIANIRFYVGYPGSYVYKNPRLEGAIQTIGQTDSLASLHVQSIISTIQTFVEPSLQQHFLEAGIKKVGVGNEVEYFDHMLRLKELRSMGKMYCGQLSKIFGVPLANDVFSATGYSGDNWMSGNYMRNFHFGLGWK